MTMELAVIMNRLPGEVAAMGYRDTLDFLTVHAKRRHDEQKFTAAVHGRELKD